ILPAHLAHGSDRGPEEARFAFQRCWRRIQDGVDRGLHRFIRQLYRPALEVCLSWRYTTLATALAMLLLTSGLFAGGWIHFAFIPKLGGVHAIAHVELPLGTPAEFTSDLLRSIEEHGARAVRQIEAETGEPIARHMYT